MNEWVRWVLEQHPSQNQITTIKKFWKCHKLEDYEKVFKDEIEYEHSYWWNGKDYSNEWVDHKYGWELDRLFDIQKFVPDCPLLSKVDIGYFAIKDTLNSEKWAPYLQVIAEYKKKDVQWKRSDNLNRQNEPHTFRIVKLDLGEFQIYARQARALWNESKRIHVSNSNTKNEVEELNNGYKAYWDEEQVVFITVPKIKINKSLLKGTGSVSLQKEKRLYIFNNNTYGVHANRYRLPELYYPTNMKEFIAYCHDKDLFDFAQSAISLWVKTDKDADWSEEKVKYWGDWFTPEYCIKQTPWPMRNIKTEAELDSYIHERKELKVIEISEKLSKHAIAIYDKAILFPEIKTITQELCDEFIAEYNNRKLYEIIK